MCLLSLGDYWGFRNEHCTELESSKTLGILNKLTQRKPQLLDFLGLERNHLPESCSNRMGAPWLGLRWLEPP